MKLVFFSVLQQQQQTGQERNLREKEIIKASVYMTLEWKRRSRMEGPLGLFRPLCMLL